MWHNAGDQPDLQRPIGIDDIAGEQQLRRSLAPHELCEATDSRYVAAKSALDEEFTEARLLRRHAYVCHQRQLHSPSDSGAIDCRMMGMSVCSSASAAGVSRAARLVTAGRAPSPPAMICFTSSPEQNAGSAPVMIRHRTAALRTASSSSR